MLTGLHGPQALITEPRSVRDPLSPLTTAFHGFTVPAVRSILLKLRFRVNSNPTLSASLVSIVYEHRVDLACNVQGMPMALNLYRTPPQGIGRLHPEDTRPGQFEEGRGGWKKCAGLIHVSGTLAGSSTAGRPAPPIGTKRRPLLLCGNNQAHAAARKRLSAFSPARYESRTGTD